MLQHVSACVRFSPSTEENVQMTLETKLAHAFTEIVRKSFSARELAEIVKRNRVYRKEGRMCCATQEFCDANMLMEEAFIKVMEREPDVGSDQDADLWNAAWSKAADAEFKY